MTEFSDAELSAFLDEELSAERSSQLEAVLRTDPAMQDRLREVRGRSIAGLHTIGEIWRRRRLSCPDRETLGRYLMATMPQEEMDAVEFHLDEIGCRFCQANLDDLNARLSGDPQSEARRDRWFQTSAGHLRPAGKDAR